jgi:CDP-paratose 2-epimerase
VLEAIERFEDGFGRKLAREYLDEPRRGDHICYISNLASLTTDYPEWEVTISLDEIFDQLVGIAAPAAPA